MNDFLTGFVIVFVLFYWALGGSGKSRLRKERDDYADQVLTLTAENLRLKAEMAALKMGSYQSKADPYAYWRQQQQYQNPFQNAYNPFTGFNYGQNFSQARQYQAPPLSEWRRTFGFGASDTVTKEKLSAAFREKAMKSHPDKGGNDVDMAKLNSLRQQALSEIGA